MNENNKKTTLDGEIKKSIEFMNFNVGYGGEGNFIGQKNGDTQVKLRELSENISLYAVINKDISYGFLTEYGVVAPGTLGKYVGELGNNLYVCLENDEFVKCNLNESQIEDMEKEINGYRYLVIKDIFQK